MTLCVMWYPLRLHKTSQYPYSSGHFVLGMAASIMQLGQVLTMILQTSVCLQQWRTRLLPLYSLRTVHTHETNALVPNPD